jgi:CubicO group peptidase (beta-lactamase class C family)
VGVKVFSFFPEYSHLIDGQKGKITIEHLLTMTSGLEWNEWEYPYDERNDLIQLWIVDDPIEYILAKPVVYEPGTRFYYSGGDVNLLGEIIRRATDQSVDVFAGKYLFTPLGIEAYEWQHLTPEIVYTSGDIKMRPRDMAKFGLLYLQNGIWSGKRIVAEKWIERSTEEYISIVDLSYEDMHGYGYQWWLKTYRADSRSSESYLRTGWGGQAIIAFPELDMVVVFTGGNYTSSEPVHEIVTRFILQAVL